MKTLKLFNAVIAKTDGKELYISTDRGYVIEPAAIWAKDQIVKYYNKAILNGYELNKTFHKSWEKIHNTPREELLVEQIRHYLSTYGTNFQGEVYIPNEVLEVPDLDTKVCFKVVKGYTEAEMTKKCLDMLASGIALKEETINDLLTVLIDELKYVFTGKEKVRNKEAVIKLADSYGVLPQNTMEFFRYIVYRATGQSLLIKSPQVIQTIKDTNFNPAAQFNKFGLARLAEIFNRFKPLFLAFKPQCRATINKISKLSKSNHKPLVENPLNHVTHSLLKDEHTGWLDNATPYALFKALSALKARSLGQNSFVYRVRNGKSWVTEKGSANAVINSKNYEFILEHMKKRFDLSDRKIFIPEGVGYALPTSEKMYVGNIPTGSKFYGERLAVGVYWENDWGARDIDLSGINVNGSKVGWNASFLGGGGLAYSGDITNAPNGAVEYLHANKGYKDITLVQTNIFSGNDDCGYKIIVGKGNKITKKHMMDPNNLLLDVKTQSVQKQSILGVFMPDVTPVEGEKTQSFTLLNFGAGHTRVSGGSKQTKTALTALIQQWFNPVDFRWLVESLGAEIVEKQEDADYNLGLEHLERDSFLKVFEEKVVEEKKEVA